MKSLNALLTTIVVGVIIASCSLFNGQEDPEPEYPKVFETWQVNSPSNAEWIGSDKSKITTVQEVDTIEITSPQGHYITMTQDEGAEHGEVDFTYTDSTQFNWEKVNLDTTQIEFPEYGFPNVGQEIGIGGKGLAIGEESLQIRFDLQWMCDAQLEENPILWVHFYQDNGNPFRHYRVDMDGFEDAIRNVGCVN